MLKNFDVPTNHLSDQKRTTGIPAMRRATKNILYTVENSQEYAPENLDTGMQQWEKNLIELSTLPRTPGRLCALLQTRSRTKSSASMTLDFPEPFAPKSSAVRRIL